MKIRYLFLCLLFGILGGFVAFFLSDRIFERKSETIQELDLIGSGVSQTNHSGVRREGRIDLREAARKSVPGVVHVKTIEIGREYYGNSLLHYFFGVEPETREVPRTTGAGSGVIISEDGYIITNNHVVKGANRVLVVLNDNREFDARLVGQDAYTDIALLKIEGENLPHLEYGNSDEVSLGEWVLAVGNPFNLTSTVTAGIISAKARELGLNRGRMSLESFLQTDAAINPGNSGGALVNTKGELIGINTLIQSPTGVFSGYAFAIPVNIVRKVVNDLRSYGKVQRAVFGIRMGELTPALAEELGVKETSGIYVGEVLAGGAAQKAGIKEGDIIQGINDIEVKTSPEFYEQLSKYNPGKEIQVKIKRKGQEKIVNVVLQNSYGDRKVVIN